MGYPDPSRGAEAVGRADRALKYRLGLPNPVFGTCPACKKWVRLTKHHDKQIRQVVMICRNCHNIIEEYLKAQAKTREAASSKDGKR